MPLQYQLQTRHIPEHAALLNPNTSALMARLYASRGVASSDELELKLNKLLPAKDLLGIDQAIQKLDHAIDQDSKILIIGDFDADGATSTALIVLSLRQLGAVVDYLVPDRFKFGYGLTPEIVQLAISDYTPDLIVTVDNGISSHAGVQAAHDAGIQVIITDHHLTTKIPPVCAAVVNPNQPECQFASKALAGVGVAFYVMAALASYRREQQKSTLNMTQYLDLVAVGTVADVAPLDYNNRILVSAGLARIRQGQCRAGILAILDIAGREAAKLTAQDFGFVIGPRINAAGRMDNMRIGIECLLADNFELAYPIAQQLDALNRERRQVETQMRDDALSLLAEKSWVDEDHLSPAIVLFEPTWHQGVIGIVAGRLKEQFHRPTIVFAPSEDGANIKGSARSIAGVHIRDAIEQVAEQYPDLISHFGGHAMAAGLTLPLEHFDEFARAFIQVIAAHDDSLFNAVLLTDGELMDAEFCIETAQDIASAGPWGQVFPAPVFEGVFEVLEQRWLKDQHLKLKLKNQQHGSLEAIAFRMSDQLDMSMPLKQVHIAYQLDINEFRGQQKLQLLIMHLQPM
jgi:single-stranded-DNA-specific exonuclease